MNKMLSRVYILVCLVQKKNLTQVESNYFFPPHIITRLFMIRYDNINKKIPN